MFFLISAVLLSDFNSKFLRYEIVLNLFKTYYSLLITNIIPPFLSVITIFIINYPFNQALYY